MFTCAIIYQSHLPTTDMGFVHGAGWDNRPKEEAAQDGDSFRLPRGSLELLGQRLD